jgi:hypothetical protein
MNKEVSTMASGRIKGYWHRMRKAMLLQGNPDYADSGIDTPERIAEKKLDAAHHPQRYPGDNVPPAVWGSSGGPPSF